jgi:hypothetical protein
MAIQQVGQLVLRANPGMTASGAKRTLAGPSANDRFGEKRTFILVVRADAVYVQFRGVTSEKVN